MNMPNANFLFNALLAKCCFFILIFYQFCYSNPSLFFVHYFHLKQKRSHLQNELKGDLCKNYIHIYYCCLVHFFLSSFS